MNTGTRRSLLYLVSIAALVATLAQNIYTPTLISVRHDFATSNALVGSSVAAYAFTLAAGQLIYGPLVDLFSARRILTFGLLIFIAASVLAFFAPTIELFIGLRALQAAGVGAATVVGAAVISDLFPTGERGRAMGRFQTFSAIGGTLGSAVGSTMLLVAGWRYNFLLLAVAGLGVVVGARLLMPPMSVRTPQLSFAAASRIVLTPASLGILLVGFLQMAANFNFHTFLPALYHEKAGVPEGLVGYIFMFASVAALVGAAIGGQFVDRVDRRRLCIVSAAATLLPTVGMALAAYLPYSSMTLPSLLLSMLVHYVALGVSILVQFALTLEWFPHIRGTAVGTFTAARFLGGTVGPIVGGLAVDTTGFLWAAFAVATVAQAAGLLVAAALVASPTMLAAGQVATPGAAHEDRAVG